VKIVHDQFEEERLRENIQFWREKVDLLFKEKKDCLNQQMIMRKAIRRSENLVEDLKQQIKAKDELVECYQIEKKIAQQKLKVQYTNFIQSNNISEVDINLEDVDEIKRERYSDNALAPNRSRMQNWMGN